MSEHKEFTPYIFINHSLQRPTNITAVAFIGISCFKHIHLPEGISGKSLWEQIEIVKDVIEKHYSAKEGKCPLFGDITGYLYFYQKNEWIEFSIDGSVKGYKSGDFAEPKAALKIGSKIIRDGLLK